MAVTGMKRMPRGTRISLIGKFWCWNQGAPAYHMEARCSWQLAWAMNWEVKHGQTLAGRFSLGIDQHQEHKNKDKGGSQRKTFVPCSSVLA